VDVHGGVKVDDKLREAFEAAIGPHFVVERPPFNFRMPDGSYFYAQMNLAWKAYLVRPLAEKQLRAALEYTNVLLEKLPASEEITYRLNANKVVLSETKN
jgi:hypothetical protein